MSAAPATIYTIGHGNRPLQELIELLAANRIGCLVDVRAFPGSRKHPHFGRGELEKSLPAAGIDYVWAGKALGGRRRARADSPHVAMRNESFRAYADHMQAAEFHEGIQRLLELARDTLPAIMCAERLPWQCHRYMISDYLVAHGVEVFHVIDASPPRAHVLRSEARREGDDLIYDVGAQPPLDLG